MTLLRLLRQARRLYPLLGVCDLLIAGLEELIFQNNPRSGIVVGAGFKSEMEELGMDTSQVIGVPWIREILDE